MQTLNLIFLLFWNKKYPDSGAFWVSFLNLWIFYNLYCRRVTNVFFHKRQNESERWCTRRWNKVSALVLFFITYKYFCFGSYFGSCACNIATRNWVFMTMLTIKIFLYLWPSEEFPGNFHYFCKNRSPHFNQFLLRSLFFLFFVLFCCYFPVE